jgi:ribosomal protein S4E
MMEEHFKVKNSINVNDTCLINLPEFGIKNHVQLKEGCSVIVTRGENAEILVRLKKLKLDRFPFLTCISRYG